MRWIIYLLWCFEVLVLELHIIILRDDRHQFATLCSFKRNNISDCKDPNKWICMTFSQTWSEYITVSTDLVAKRWQQSSMRVATRTSLFWRDDLHSTVLLICNTVGCLMQQPGGVRSRLSFRKDQSLASVATTVNLFVACLLNYSYEMCILVLTDHSGNSVMLKRTLSLCWRGAEVNFRLHFKFTVQIRTSSLHVSECFILLSN